MARRDAPAQARIQLQRGWRLELGFVSLSLITGRGSGKDRQYLHHPRSSQMCMLSKSFKEKNNEPADGSRGPNRKD